MFRNWAITTAFSCHKNELKELRTRMEDVESIKFSCRLRDVLEEVKGEWGAFGANFYDFELVEKIIGVRRGIKEVKN